MGTPPTEAEFLLLIADISGYTRFMMTNHTARVHAHGVISDLIAAVLKQVQLPLEVNKLEGDAIFLVAAKQDDGWIELGTTNGCTLSSMPSTQRSPNLPTPTSAHASPASRWSPSASS
jgi:hypothetical protein